MAYFIQNPIHELYIDGLVYANKAKDQKDRFRKCRYLRISVVMMLASIEAVLHNLWSREITNNPQANDNIFKGKFPRYVTTEDKWKAFLKHKYQPFNPNNKDWQFFIEFNDTRHEIIHYKGNAEVFYKRLEKNIDKYVGITKQVFLIIFGEPVMKEWDKKLTETDGN